MPPMQACTANRCTITKNLKKRQKPPSLDSPAILAGVFCAQPRTLSRRGPPRRPARVPAREGEAPAEPNHLTPNPQSDETPP